MTRINPVIRTEYPKAPAPRLVSQYPISIAGVTGYPFKTPHQIMSPIIFGPEAACYA